MPEQTETEVQNALHIEHQDAHIRAYIELVHTEERTEIYYHGTYTEPIPQPAPAPAVEDTHADDHFRIVFEITPREFFLSVMVSLMLLQKSVPTILETILTFHLRSTNLDGLEILKVALSCGILFGSCLVVFMEHVFVHEVEDRLNGWLEILEMGI